ncbi:MAG: type IX secretion system sortase PorU [Bacteroidetes bacterium]|nr:type IX secretion system sortase PorU [Bacteroidota bacterium]
MRIKKTLLCIFIIFNVLSSNIIAQQKALTESIKWQNNISKSLDSNYSERLNFKDAVYNDLNSLLPFYFKRIKLSNITNDVDVNITNTSFSNFKSDELKNIKIKKNFQSNIKINYKIKYDRKIPYLYVNFIPIVRNKSNGKLQKLQNFTISITEKSSAKKSTKLKSHKQNSILNSGNWFKIKIDKTGVYKLTYNDLINIGISKPENVRIYGNGGSMLPIKNSAFRYDDLVENPIFMEKGSDGIFNQDDYIIFYAQNSVEWKYNEQEQLFYHSVNMYTDYSYYFLTSDLASGKKITTENIPSANITNNIFTYDDYAFFEKNDTNLIRSGREWFGEAFRNQTSYNFSFQFPNRDVSVPIKIKTHVASHSSNSYPDSYFKLTSDNADIQTIYVPGFNTGSSYSAAKDKTASSFFSNSNKNLNINIKYFGTSSSSEGWLNYIFLNVRQNLSMTKNQINFRDIISVGSGNISQFTLSNATQNIKIWDVSNISDIKQISTQYSNNKLTFKLATDTLREFIAFTGDEFFTPIIQGDDLGKIENQNLHALNFYDLIIVTHPDFKSYADELADFHINSDNLKVLSVTSSQVYNEFSSGKPDVAAIRDFMKMFYDRATTEEQLPKYLLLFGDGSYDNKTQSNKNSNYILTYQSKNSLDGDSSFSTDDFYAMLDDDEGGYVGAVDIGVGRLPVRTEDEAQSVTNKIKNYYNKETIGDWRNSICFIGDDEDNNDYMRNANELSKKILTNHPTYNIDKIFLDAYPQISTPSGQRYPDVTNAINNKMKKGALLINYIGHGNPTKFSHEEVITINDVTSWTNYNQLPLFMTASCEVSRFDDYARTSIGELILLNPNGGGIALLSTTRLVSSGANNALNKNFINFVFNKDLRLGDIVRLTKVNTGSDATTNKRNFTLLGDPALKLNIPRNNVVTTKINNTPITENIDTLNALSKITIQGFVQDEAGNKLTDFNGLISPTIYDKPVSKTTLSNDGLTPFTYNLQKNIIYKGNASVNNGDFTFSFIVPKDISYNYGNGKISYYADNSNIDATGFFNNIIIGGSADTAFMDSIGPKMNIYMNDSNFVFNGLTDENPKLLVIVTDSTGINTVGNGIGHDITAVLDDNENQAMILNDYYQADVNSYQRGKIEYPFSNLDEGHHKIKLKVWDIYNNSSENYIEFNVAKSENLILEHVYNYPNPFTTSTSFLIEHNQAGADLDIIIQIFTITGKIVKTIETQSLSDGYRINPIPWNGLDEYNDKIARGVYIYTVRVRSNNGKQASKFGKLVILR